MRRPSLLPAPIVALLVACEGGAPAESTRPVEPATVRVTAVDTLRPGQIASVRGSGLSGLRSLRLDGVDAMELVVRSDSVAEFRVPSMRACETDMRAVKVSADGTAPIGGVVRVAPSVSLRAGESRVLTSGELQCLRLAAADEDYVLSAANVAIPTAEVESPRTLVAVRVLGTGDVASTLAASDAPSAHDAGTLAEPAMATAPAVTAPSGSFAQAPVPFDPRYATAVVGDTLRFVDWFSGAPQLCQMPAESVPSFRARVVAVSGDVAVVVDLRHPSAASYLDPAKLGWLREAAAMTDRLLLPTMRSLFDADYRPPAGGGGRFYVLLGTLPNATGFAYDGPLGSATFTSQTSCPRSSEMVVSTVSADRLAMPQNQSAGYVAGVFLHEYAHNADALTSRRGRIAGILGEGLATLAQETASRIASGQPLRARHAGVGSDAPAIADGSLGMWGTQAALGPWQSNGRYGANARMLLFLRELAGEASIDHGRRPTLYQRLVQAPIDWNDRPAVIAHVTAVLGIDYVDLIDRQALASVTAGLIGPDVVHDLPRYTAWDHAERARVAGPLSATFPGRASRRAGGEHTLAAADGGHAALYLMGDGPRGISIELVSMAPTARIVRLTRTR
ncbi:hypothetical protein [Roseisolibacter agri]|uniref:Uncharacterized protein n=1 Tax=Roseisolibacter agri TaxID=2014610 RepID=A0AA37Q7P8_9BACT|nr:hypothetical protein [Roseisolibacter agri]GLC25262.1 hypothetical protein rosag_17750 [Roseisolibacter agri]